MSRPLRIEEPGLWHHVMNRGLDRRAIFREDADYDGFLDLVAELAGRWQVFCHAACLLKNHYHLLLHDKAGYLGRAMRHLDGVHTQRFNRRHRRDGPLMRGRYRSRLVQEDRYLLEVVRYIHMNPVKAGLVERAGQYRWSSHRHYLQRKAPEWLCRDAVEASFGAGRRGGARFDAFVHERVADGAQSMVASGRWSLLVGDEEFRAKWRDEMRRVGANRRREVPETRRMVALSVAEVVAAARRVFGVEKAALLKGRRGQSNLERHLTMLACREHTAADNAEIGSRFGVAAATVSAAVTRTKKWVDGERRAQRMYRRLERGLSDK